MIYLKSAFFYNRAPFEKLSIEMNSNDIVVLTATNGKGKTTILSHIADAFYEMAKRVYSQEFEDRQNKFYRVSSSIFSIDMDKPSIAYLRFMTESQSIDYIDIRGFCSEEDYNDTIQISDKIPYQQVVRQLENVGFAKSFSSSLDDKTIDSIFSNSIMTYFPSYRYEHPGYLNDMYKKNIEYTKNARYSGYMKNPIEVITGLNNLVNWILDVILDNQYLNLKPEDLKSYFNQLDPTLKNHQELSSIVYTINSLIIDSKSNVQRMLNQILTGILSTKVDYNVRFGIGQRHFGASRIQVVNAKTGEPVYRSVFNMSSGETAVLCLFGELIRQIDNISTDFNIYKIRGIVLIDEIDKHLHIKILKEVLPKLMKFFPNIQFIVSSHSPFLNMGLAEEAKERSKIIDLDNNGIISDPRTCDLYSEVYEMMITENDRYRTLYAALSEQIHLSERPLVITEGKTDIAHIQIALSKLNITIPMIDFFNGESDSKLKSLLEQLCRIPQNRRIIGIFDRDVPIIVNDIEKEGRPYKEYGNNVYAFCIPVPNGRENYKNISIEFYYSDCALKKKKDGKCLYFDNEINFNRRGKPLSPIENPVDNADKKIYCEDIGDLDWILSKSRFAELIHDEQFAEDIDFSNFGLIINRIQQILDMQS